MKTWKSIFKSKQVRKECLYSFLILMGIRLLATIPTPGTNPDYFKTLIHDNSALTFIDAMTGNGLSGICPSVHCNADLSAYVRQGQGLVQKNKDVVKQNKDFLVRCDEQIAKRDQIIEKYQKNQVEITKKQALKKQLEEFVIPQLPEKQTNVPNEEELRLLVEQQKLIQQRMRTLEEYVHGFTQWFKKPKTVRCIMMIENGGESS